MPPASVGFLLGSLINPEDGGYVCPTHWAFTKLHDITIQATSLFIVISITISNQTILEQIRRKFGLLSVFISHCVASPQLDKTRNKPSTI
jgi:hypothetical protein